MLNSFLPFLKRQNEALTLNLLNFYQRQNESLMLNLLPFLKQRNETLMLSLLPFFKRQNEAFIAMFGFLLHLYERFTRFLSTFLSKGIKTNQLEVNTDEKTLKPIARLKEPRDLFALPKDKDYDCSQQAARWPTECQVLDERIFHIPYVPAVPEAYNQPSGAELKPRPVGEESGTVVYNYNPISAVNYNEKSTKGCDSDGTDSDISSSESRGSSPDRRKQKVKNHFAKMFKNSLRSSSNSNDDDDDDDEDDEEIIKITNHMAAKSLNHNNNTQLSTIPKNQVVNIEDYDEYDREIDDIWGVPSPYFSASPTKCIIHRIESKPVPRETILKMPQFSRSSVGGSKFLTQVHPIPKDEYDGLWFESRFESGNLAKAVKITDIYYELYLRPDLYTSRSKQWFYFRVERTRKNLAYRFSIVNLVKSDSLYNEGMRPLMYSTINAKNGLGWRRCGENISYYRNDDDQSCEEDEDSGSYTLTFTVEFPHDNDTVYFAHSYPYTYTDLQDYLMAIQKHPVKSKFCKLRLLCRSLAGNNVYYLTVTAPTADPEAMKRKKAIVVSARVHPSETPASWMMKGLMDFITSDAQVAKRLRHKFIFKLIPMLNPDGVIVGNTRNSLAGKDLNRQYRTVIRETYPSIWYTKAMIKRLIDECGVAMYCDMHAHSRRQNIFVYGCENKRSPDKKLTEQVFPLMMHKNVADKFSFENCKFKVQRSKEGTGRIVVWMLGVTNSYTIEASFGGSTLGSRKGTHFNTGDYEHMGRAFCETLLDYCDENPNKVKKHMKLFKQIKRTRKKEKRERKLLKMAKLAEEERLRLKIIQRLLKEGSSADEPLNIPLSDYSSDEGDTSSSSDNEGKAERNTELEGPCCQPLKAPPCSPEFTINPKKKVRKKRNVVFHRNNHPNSRLPLDLPTTDPGSDLFFSTDEEFCGDATGASNTYPRSRRYLLQSDLQRSYMDPTCDRSPTPIQRMPPELIVTPAKNDTGGGRQIIQRLSEKPKTNLLLYSDFQGSNGSSINNTSTRNSLHSLLGGSGKNIPKIRVKNTLEEETVKLRKKLWTVTPQCDMFGENSQPLFVPPVKNYKPKDKRKELDENEMMFTKCSQKLLAWQQETLEYGRIHKNIDDALYESETPTEKNINQRGKKNSKTTKIEVELRGRKKRNNFMQITETSKIINYFRNASNSNNSIAARRIPSLLKPTMSKTQVPKKFKTGGLVATAVQASRKPKRQRSSLLSINKPIDIPMPQTISVPTQLENEKSFARKVKTKLRKKKD